MEKQTLLKVIESTIEQMDDTATIYDGAIAWRNQALAICMEKAADELRTARDNYQNGSPSDARHYVTNARALLEFVQMYHTLISPIVQNLEYIDNKLVEEI